MAANKLSFGKRKFILKRYWKFENLADVQRKFGREFQADHPTYLKLLELEISFRKMELFILSTIYVHEDHGCKNSGRHKCPKIQEYLSLRISQCRAFKIMCCSFFEAPIFENVTFQHQYTFSLRLIRTGECTCVYICLNYIKVIIYAISPYV